MAKQVEFKAWNSKTSTSYSALNNDFLNLLKVASEFLSDLSCKSGFQICTYFGTKFKQESNNSNVRNEKKNIIVTHPKYNFLHSF